jgi:hypothetical protein
LTVSALVKQTATITTQRGSGDDPLPHQLARFPGNSRRSAVPGVNVRRDCGGLCGWELKGKGVKEIEIDFKFSPDDKVKTALGIEGIIDTCAINCSGEKTYYVNLPSGGVWFKESLLIKV